MKGNTITFQMEDENYRVRCVFNHERMTPNAWWGFIEKLSTRRRFWLFGKHIKYWKKVDSCWWTSYISTKEELQECATDLYNERVADKIKAQKDAKTILNQSPHA